MLWTALWPLHNLKKNQVVKGRTRIEFPSIQLFPGFKIYDCITKIWLRGLRKQSSSYKRRYVCTARLKCLLFAFYTSYIDVKHHFSAHVLPTRAEFDRSFHLIARVQSLTPNKHNQNEPAAKSNRLKFSLIVFYCRRFERTRDDFKIPLESSRCVLLGAFRNNISIDDRRLWKNKCL